MISAAFVMLWAAQAGHWEGAIKLPDRDFLFSVDLDSTPEWHGTFSIPGQDAPPLLLSGIEIAPPSIHFEIREAPGDPLFKGLMEERNSVIRGTLTQQGRTVAFTMRRTGDPQIAEVARSTPLASEFLGNWEGTVRIEQPIRLILHLRNGDEGLGEGTLDTVQEGAKNLVLSTVRQSGSTLDFEVRLIGGRFHGDISGDGAKLSGDWKQGNRVVPLIFEKQK